MAQRVVFEESTLSYPLLTEEDVLRSDARLSSLVEDLDVRSRDCELRRQKLIEYLLLKVSTL